MFNVVENLDFAAQFEIFSMEGGDDLQNGCRIQMRELGSSKRTA